MPKTACLLRLMHPTLGASARHTSESFLSRSLSLSPRHGRILCQEHASLYAAIDADRTPWRKERRCDGDGVRGTMGGERL